MAALGTAARTLRYVSGTWDGVLSVAEQTNIADAVCLGAGRRMRLGLEINF